MRALHSRSRRFVGILVASVTALAATQGHAFITVLGGAHAEECSNLAKSEVATRASIEICSMAIYGDRLSARDLAGTYVNRGTMFMGIKSWGSALADFDAALRIEPDLAEAHVNRGATLMGLKRYEEALVELDRGIALNSSQIEKAYGNRAMVKWALDDVRGAYFDFLRTQELKPDWAWPAEQLAHFTVQPAQP